MYSFALSIEIISDVEFSRRLVESRSDNLKQVKSCKRKQFNSPPQLENQSQCRRKTIQLVSRNETTQQEKTTQFGSRNETTQQEKTTQFGSRNETTQLGNRIETPQLVSRNETTQLCIAVDRLQPSAPPLQQNRLFLPTLMIFWLDRECLLNV
ncbi:hypothetical protein TNCV_1098981 [Trichonephila clavipes]|nr:hypothetical protein TNCV_1098981 [Trichonephila clavipes]